MSDMSLLLLVVVWVVMHWLLLVAHLLVACSATGLVMVLVAMVGVVVAGYPAEAAVVAQGAADTVILDNLITELQTQLCDSKSRIATLESNAFTTASNAAQTQQIINTILPHILTKSTTA